MAVLTVNNITTALESFIITSSDLNIEKYYIS